jgi:hypothetical protein
LSPYSSISDKLGAPAITAKIAMVMILVSKCHLLLSTLGSFISVNYSWNLLLISLLSILGTEDIFVLLFFCSNPVGITQPLRLDGLNLNLP